MRPGVSARFRFGFRFRFRFRFHDTDGQYMRMEDREGRMEGGALGQLVRRGMTEPCN